MKCTSAFNGRWSMQEKEAMGSNSYNLLVTRISFHHVSGWSFVPKTHKKFSDDIIQLKGYGEVMAAMHHLRGTVFNPNTKNALSANSDWTLVAVSPTSNSSSAAVATSLSGCIGKVGAVTGDDEGSSKFCRLLAPTSLDRLPT
jgi:hypothetical protein